jgi:lysophospholipase L1-like esterase
MLETEGTPNPKLFIEDGLHLNVTGYDLWTKIVRDRIAQTLN